MKAGLTG